MKTKVRRNSKLTLLAGLLWLAPCMTHGQAADDNSSASLQMSVRELMRLDADLALKHLRNRMRKENPGGEIAEASMGQENNGALRLVAIYGVGPNLLAEVMIGIQPHVFLRGKALAVGAKAGPSQYLLRGISGSCVHLERRQESHTLCLQPGLWAVRK